MNYDDVAKAVDKKRLVPKSSTHKTVSFMFPTADACMLQAIALQMGVSTSTLGGEMFSPLVAQLYASLPEEQKQVVAQTADAIIRRQVKRSPLDCTNQLYWQNVFSESKK